MNKQNFLFIALLSVFLVVSCDQIRDNCREQKAIENYVSPYKGIWVGNYSGSESGTLKVEVFTAGNLQITRAYQNTSETFYGTITDYGAFQNTVSQTSGFQMLGGLSSQSNNPTGNWKQNGMSGYWNLSKQ